MSIEIFVQARMGSTRLPGKVLRPVLDIPLLGYLVERLKRVKEAQNFVILTSTDPQDDVIASFCKKNAVLCFRGPEDDVLLRYYQAAQVRTPAHIVRITADCPLADPEVIDRVISAYKTASPAVDYATNGFVRSYPRGYDVEIFSFEALQKAAIHATQSEEREHVTPYLYRHPETFRLLNVAHDTDLSRFRLTVDTPEDFELIRLILEHLYPIKPTFCLSDVMALLEQHPEWVKINAHIQQKP